MSAEHELFFKVAKHLGINVTDISLLSQVEVNKAYLRIIENQILIQLDKVIALKRYMQDEIAQKYTQTTEDYYDQLKILLDLEVEYAAKQSYIIHHEKFTSKQP